MLFFPGSVFGLAALAGIAFLTRHVIRAPAPPAERLGRTGDGGVDGVINEDVLGLGRVYVQAKHYLPGNTVGRPELQAFTGSLVGLGAVKGVGLPSDRLLGRARYTV